MMMIFPHFRCKDNYYGSTCEKECNACEFALLHPQTNCSGIFYLRSFPSEEKEETTIPAQDVNLPRKNCANLCAVCRDVVM